MGHPIYYSNFRIAVENGFQKYITQSIGFISFIRSHKINNAIITAK